MVREPGTGVSFRVGGTPATFATRSEASWRQAVSEAAQLAMSGDQPLTGRLKVEIDFVVAMPSRKGMGWDLDNLIKPTIDALTPVIGPRKGNWKRSQPDDERVDEIVARKRPTLDGEMSGAEIAVTVITSPTWWPDKTSRGADGDEL